MQRLYRAMGKIQKIGYGVPYQRSNRSTAQSLNFCLALLVGHRRKSFLWCLVSGYKK